MLELQEGQEFIHRWEKTPADSVIFLLEKKDRDLYFFFWVELLGLGHSEHDPVNGKQFAWYSAFI